MDKSSVTLGHGELTVDASLDEISDALGNDYILSDTAEGREFAYLAALALETQDNDSYDIERTLMEFIRNEDTLNIDASDCNEIEAILR